ncbi:MAG: hypothetical protein IMZ50_12655 [Candidatus Atribacteria bacterium]|nr:hypothetical protein [Candidatus Atribacteria bacterium]
MADTIELTCSRCGRRVLVYTEDWLREGSMTCPKIGCGGTLLAPWPSDGRVSRGWGDAK